MTTAFLPIHEVEPDAVRAAQIVEGVIGNAWAADAAGKFIYVTPTMLARLGMTLNELNSSVQEGGLGWKRIIHPDDYDGAMAAWRRCLRTGEHYDVEHRVLRSSGAYAWSRSSGQALRDGRGGIVAWYGTLIDADIPPAARERFADAASATLDERAAPGVPHSLSRIHPDDRTAASHAAARAFWTGVPQVTRHRLLQEDGSYRWTETRSEPGYDVSVDIDDLVTDREPLARTAGDPSGESEVEPVRSAKVIESIFGNGWAFDATGRWIYLHQFARNSLGVTLDDLNASLEEGHTAWKRLLHPDDYDQIAATWRRCLETGDHFNVEFRFRRASGVYVWARTAARPTRDSQGRITGWFGIALDIDVYKKTVSALRQRERGLQQLIDTVPALIWCTTAGGTPTYVNKRFRNVTGATLEDITAPDGSPSLSVIHPDDVEAARKAVVHSFATGEPYVQRYRQLRSDGSYRWTETRAEPLRDDAGEILQWYGVSVDIHDLVIAQEALQQSERRYRDLFHYMPIGLTQIDAGKLVPLFRELRAQGVTDLRAYIDEHPEFLPRAVEALEVEEVNQHIVDMFGARNAAEMRGPVTRYWQPAMATIRRSIEARYRGEEVFQEETKVARMDGGVIDVLFKTARPGAVADKSLVGFVDITERKKAEEALRNSKRQLEQMIDAVPVNILSFSPSGKMTYASKQYLEQVGSPMAHIDDFEALARDVAHPEDFPTMFRRASNGFATGEPFVNRFRRRDKHGVYRWIEARAQPLRDTNGAIVQWYIASIDIEDEMRAQDALRERERFLWQLVETLPALIDCAAPNGEPVYRSQQLREFLGYQLEMLDGAGKSRLDGTLDAGVHPDDVAGVKEQYAHCLATGEPYARRHRLRRFDGEYRWVETRAAPMRNAEGAIIQWNVICLDIDGEIRAQEELRSARERLARASQAASLAELSASIAHEVNQPLAAIVANSHACKRWLTAEPPNNERAQRTVERIIRDANSAADVVNRIRALFRQSVDRRAHATLGGLVAEARNLMAEEAARRRVRMDIEVESDLPPVALDRVQIQQVLINLMRNGMESMDSVPDGRILGVRVRRAGNSIQTEIRDLGRGIEFPDKIFEPFFTTKEHGMGMGLAICRSIVESHGGRLWVEKNDSQGAMFIFTLPLSEKARA